MPPFGGFGQLDTSVIITLIHTRWINDAELVSLLPPRTIMTSLRVVSAATSALLLSVSSAIGVSSVASASEYWCTVSADLPPTIAISSRDTRVPLTISDQAGCAGVAHYNVVRSDGQIMDDALFVGGQTKSLWLDPSSGPGVYSAFSDSAVDEDGDEMVAEDSARMDARFESAASFKTSRLSKKKIRFSFNLERYSYDRGYVPWSGTRIWLQKHTSDGWVDRAVVHTNRRGSATTTLNSFKARWRIYVEDASSVWGGTWKSWRA